jgi:hypothetical protein
VTCRFTKLAKDNVWPGVGITRTVPSGKVYCSLWKWILCSKILKIQVIIYNSKIHRQSMQNFHLHSSVALFGERIRDILSIRTVCVQSRSISKGKATHYRSWPALMIPGGWDSQILRQSAHEVGKVFTPTHRLLLPTRKYSWYSFLLEAEDYVNEKFQWHHRESILRPSGL